MLHRLSNQTRKFSRAVPQFAPLSSVNNTTATSRTLFDSKSNEAINKQVNQLGRKPDTQETSPGTGAAKDQPVTHFADKDRPPSYESMQDLDAKKPEDKNRPYRPFEDSVDKKWNTAAKK
jgi:hypothetical protein